MIMERACLVPLIYLGSHIGRPLFCLSADKRACLNLNGGVYE